MRILAVNPNTTEAVTRRFVEEARHVAPGTVVDGVTGTFGAAIVSTRAEAVVAAHATLDLLARHGAGYDAAILAISFDTGLAAARDLMPCPVVGITEAALQAACAEVARAGDGGRVGLVTFGAQSLPLYQDMLTAYGLAGRVATIEVVPVESAAGYLDPAARDSAVLGAVARLAEAGAGAAVICGAAIVGMARRLQPAAALPLHDGAAPSVARALRLAETFVPTAPPCPLAPTTGLSNALARLIAGHGPAPGADHARPV